MRTYTTNEGRLPALQTRFRDHTLGFFKKYDMTSIGYWVPDRRADGADDARLHPVASEPRGGEGQLGEVRGRSRVAQGRRRRRRSMAPSWPKRRNRCFSKPRTTRRSSSGTRCLRERQDTMTRRTLLLVAVLALVPALRLVPPAPSAQQAAASRLAGRLSGSEFFKLSAELSEADGFFRSDNLVSNEQFMQRVIPELTRTVKAGRVVSRRRPGTELHLHRRHSSPAMAFIIDIRRGNTAAALDVQGALRVVVRSRRLRLATLLAEAPGRTRPQVDSAGNLYCLSRFAAAERRTCTSRT